MRHLDSILAFLIKQEGCSKFFAHLIVIVFAASNFALSSVATAQTCDELTNQTMAQLSDYAEKEYNSNILEYGQTLIEKMRIKYKNDQLLEQIWQNNNNALETKRQLASNSKNDYLRTDEARRDRCGQ